MPRLFLLRFCFAVSLSFVEFQNYQLNLGIEFAFFGTEISGSVEEEGAAESG